MTTPGRIALYPGLLLALGLAILVTFLWVELATTGGILSAPLDDTWIHLVFGRSLAAGHGFAFNPGDPTPGSTSPLWTVAMVPIMWFTTDPEVVLAYAIALSAAAYLATGLLVFGWTNHLAGSRPLALLAGLATLAAGRIAWAGLSGMEAPLFAALTVGALWAYSDYRLTPFVAFLLGLAGQVRPEAHLLFVLMLADTGWTAMTDRGHPWRGRVTELWRALWLPLSIYTLILLPYTLFALSTTGHPLPNTYYAKAAEAGQFSLRPLREAISYAWQDNPVAFVLLAPGLPALWTRNRPAAAWLLGLPLAYAFVVSELWHHGRYLLPLLPVQMAAGVLGWRTVRNAAGTQIRLPQSVWTALGLVLVAGGSFNAFTSWAEMLGTNAREILDIDVALGRWLAANTAADDLIAVDDIGAIGYLSGRRLVDLNGLVSPELWPAVRLPDRLARNRELARLLSASRPAWVASFPLWRLEIITNPQVAEEVWHVNTPSNTIIFQPDAYVHRVDWPYLVTASPSHPAEAEWAGVIRLLGHDFRPRADDQPQAVVLYWRSLAPVDQDYKTFAHFIGPDGNIHGQADGYQVAGLAPTSLWRTGDILRDRLTVPAGLPPGNYELRIGFYLESTGERLPLSAAAGDAWSLGMVAVE